MSYKRRCAYCGKETDELIDNLCRECYEKLRLNQKEEYIRKIKICRICGSIYYKNKKVDYEKIKDLINDKTKIEYFICDECKKRISKKYNLIIQIRNLDKKMFDEVMKILEKNKDYIKKIEDISDNAIDIYVYARRDINKSYIKYFKKMKLNIKVTKKIVGYDRQHNKKKYILTILLHR
jgi:NMD protein affecting ribosome stability and mRNA decay